MKWLPISEAPKDANDRLLWTIDGYAVVGHMSYVDSHLWYCELETTGDYVTPTHWMPLPEPPEEAL